MSGISLDLAETINTYYIHPYTKTFVWSNIFYKLHCIDFEKYTRYLNIKDAAETCYDEYIKLVLDVIYTKVYICKKL